ncbi:hypothetical protein J6590_091676 [Homalodisca vitripennis]|nr:hypothetical protein J6590_091676 [Homalodisca vitripennis]
MLVTQEMFPLECLGVQLYLKLAEKLNFRPPAPLHPPPPITYSSHCRSSLVNRRPKETVEDDGVDRASLMLFLKGVWMGSLPALTGTCWVRPTLFFFQGNMTGILPAISPHGSRQEAALPPFLPILNFLSLKKQSEDRFETK